VALGLVLQSASAQCANFFFSAAGNDTLDCMTQATACATIAKANSLTLTPGSTLNFRGGHTFAGCLTINRTNVPSGGSPGNPIVVGSYGTGMARFNSTCTGNLVGQTLIDGVSGVTVQNLILSGNGMATGAGIMVQNSYSTTVAVDTVLIQNNDISGFYRADAGQSGAEVMIIGVATNGNCGPLRNISVLNNTLHGTAGITSPDDQGIGGFGCRKNISNVKYSGNTVFNMGGHATAPPGTTGNGIIANGVSGGELSFNIAHDLGANWNGCGGPVGIWANNSDAVVIQFNEVYRVQPVPNRGGCDFTGYDLDADVTNSIIQYNYSHDNAGAGVLLFNQGTWGPNTVRHNVSENDGNQSGNGAGAFALSPGGAFYVYNNTVYRSTVFPDITPNCFDFGATGGFAPGTLLANNLCIMAGYAQVNGDAHYIFAEGDLSNVTIINNFYFNPNGFDHWWINGFFRGLAAVLAGTGKEANSLNPTAIPVVSAGTGGICTWTPARGDGPQPCPQGYQLIDGSLGIGAGADLTMEPFSLNVGQRDYYGSAIPHIIGSGYNMGAD
jgi:hypothetical protein